MNAKPTHEWLPTHVSAETFAQLTANHELVNGKYLVIVVHGEQMLSPVKVVEQREQRR